VPFSSKRITKLHQLAAAVALALSTGWAGSADAAGLGRLTVQSGLGQPLRAEVEVTALSKDEAGSLSARLAPVEAFKQAGLEYNAALASLRFAVDRRPDGRAVIKITSAQPVNEPFVDLLVELNWATGKFVREYTFLLDPPELKIAREPVPGSTPVAPLLAPPTAAVQPSAAPQAAPPVVSLPPVASTSSPQAPIAPAAPRATQQPPAASAVSKAISSGDIKVKRGDTLAAIASRSKPSGVSLSQAAVAIYNANPEAFFGSVNRLKAGATLSIPDQTVMAAVDQSQARSQVSARSGETQRARALVASKPRRLSVAKAGQSASGRVTANGADSAVVAPKSDQLKLSKSKPSVLASDKNVATGNKQAADRAERAEAKVATGAAVKEAQGRVVDLEKNVASLQKLLDLKNKQLAELQKQVDDGKSAGPKSATGSISKVEPAAPVASIKLPEVKAPEIKAPEVKAPEVKAPEIKAPEVKLADIKAPEIKAPEIKLPEAKIPDAKIPDVKAPEIIPPIVSTPAASANLPETTPVTPAPVAAAPTIPPVPVSSPAVAETSMIDDVLENPLALGGLGGLALLGGGYALYAMRKRKKVEKFEDSIIAGDGLTANSLFGSTGGQIVDTTSNNSVFATAMNTNSEASATEVDPVAEAEVYIAYGREAQAEEILKEALKKSPDRQNARLKLLEIMAGRKDVAAFGAVAKDMYEQTGGHNEEWPKVITLGLSIDPNNALYTGANPESGFGAGSLPNDDNPPTFMAELSNGSDQRSSNASRAAFAPTEPMKNSADEFAGLDFDLGSDDSTIGKAANRLSSAPAPAVSKGGGSGLEKAIGGTFDLPTLDLGSSKQVSAFDSGANPLADLGDFKIDLPSLEKLDSKMDTPAIDLSSIGLDLHGSSHDGHGSHGDTAVASSHAAVDLSSADNVKWQEMATKLDLASAYEEIGDKEGAKELLNEVIKDGDPGQQQKARMMLSKI
jgi:pilus assembly protein FimV